MTIKELKKKLRGYPDTTEILIRHYDGYGHPHALPPLPDCEVESCEQGGEISDWIVLEADLDQMYEL